MGHFLSPLCTVCYGRHVELGAKFDFCDRFVINLQQLCRTSSDPQFTVFLDDLEASGAENSDSYSGISVSSVYTCDLTDFDEDSSERDSDRCAKSNVNWSRVSSSLQWFGTYIQSNFTHYRLNCFVDLVCICFCLYYIIIAAMLKVFSFRTFFF